MRTIFCFLFFVLFTHLYAQSRAQVKILSGDHSERWKTVEIGISMPETQRVYRSFLDDHARGMNPYSSHNMWMQFTCKGKKYIRPVFYREDAEPDLQANRFVTTEAEYPWRVRFCPPDTGNYECILLLGENEQTAQPQATGIQFHVDPGTRHGFLHTVPNSPRLQFTDGTPFFILGQNIAWSGNTSLHGHFVPISYPLYDAGYYDWFHYINNLADNGGNYVRIVMGPWSTGIEWEQPGIYNQEKAFALDSIIHLAEQRGLYVHLCLDMTTGFDNVTDTTIWNPIRRTYQKKGMTAADLLRDSSALKAIDNFVRYVHARWAYSANVAVIEVMGEVMRWQGYKGREKYFTEYFTHVNSLLRDTLHDSDHMIGTSVSQEHIDIMENPVFSFVDVHAYDNDYNCNRKRYFIYHHKAQHAGKPFLFGEMGIINGPVNACDPEDWDCCSDISMHNALWSTTFMGTMGCGLYWWQWSNDAYREANYKPLRYFIDSVAYGMIDYDDADEWRGNGLEAYYCSSGKFSAVGWVHNTSYWWGNLPALDTCRDRNGQQMIHPRDDDREVKPVDRAGRTFVINGLYTRSRYTVVFYDSRDPHRKISSITLKSNSLGKIRLTYPGGSDCAFHIYKSPIIDF